MTNLLMTGQIGLIALLLQTSVVFAQSQGTPQSPSQQREPLKMVYNAADSDDPAERLQISCPVQLGPVSDIRLNQETIGVGMRGALLSGPLDGWGNEGLSHLKNFGVPLTVVPALAGPNGTQITVDARLDRAYVWHVGIKIFSMVTMKVTYASVDGGVQRKSYRALGDKTNMWGAESEYVTTVNYGMSDLLPALARDLKLICDGGKVSAYEYVLKAPSPVKK